ncbi:hypothetical protein DFP73DRAFT_561929 [Morchella snyderi]|nr:hypothetical protein DFP73DRAFT_561929 [Morchella snyderi]
MMLLFLTPHPVSHVYLIPLCALLCVLFCFFPFCKFPPPLFVVLRFTLVISFAVFVWEFVIFCFSFCFRGGVCMISVKYFCWLYCTSTTLYAILVYRFLLIEGRHLSTRSSSLARAQQVM